jgi:excisionase family DNA binding protein
MSHDASFSVGERTTPKVLSTANTARLLDCSTRTLYRLIERGELTPVRLGRVLRFELDEIRRYLDEHREAVP